MKYFGYSISKIINYWKDEKVRNLKYFIKFILPNKKHLEKTKSLRNSKKGKKALVLGNGPSLKLLDPKKVLKLKEDGYDIFAVHSYLISDFAKIVKPTHYIITDSDWIWPERETKGKEFSEEIKKNNSILNSLDLTLFLPINYKNYHKFTNNIYFINDSEDFFKNYHNNILKPRPFSSITGLKGMWIADFMGYDEIYICGIDGTDFRTFIIDDNNKLISNFDHFYSPERKNKISYENNHDTGSFLYVNHIVFKDLKKFPKKIINLDPNSYVDAFSKKHLLEVYK